MWQEHIARDCNAAKSKSETIASLEIKQSHFPVLKGTSQGVVASTSDDQVEKELWALQRTVAKLIAQLKEATEMIGKLEKSMSKVSAIENKEAVKKASI